MSLVDRASYRRQIQDSLAHFRVTALLGPRQCGKTTLARGLATRPDAYFDLEDPLDLARLEAPRQTLGPLTGLVVIDEIQRRPDLFPLLRVLADRQETPARFLILGSASLDLVKGVSESLAGRVGFVDLSGFDATEVGFEQLNTLWLRGGFPESFLSQSDEASLHWRQQFIRTFLTRDIPQLGITIPSEQLRRFWLMVAHYHGQTWNASEIAGSLGVNYKTAQHYLDILTGSFMIRSLPPWVENLGKRVRKAPKIYLRDSGLFHALQGIRSLLDLQAHPKLGASWEGLALEHVLRVLRVEPGEAFHWGTHGGAELDLLLVRNGRRWGFELKYADAPRTTKSMRAALDDLHLEQLVVIYPGEHDYALDDRIHVLALRNVEGLRNIAAVTAAGDATVPR
jgi:predicted AAA+ superfamily ATPase